MDRRSVLKLGGLAWLTPPSSVADSMMTTIPRRAPDRRAELYGLLGALPDRNRPIHGKKRGEDERDGYVLETWDLDLNGIETVPAYLARPRSVSGRVPGVVFNHSHGGGYTIGKKEFVEGRSYLQPVPYAKVLTDLGYVALCIDAWVFGERSHTSESDMFKAMLWRGQVLWGMMVYDSLRAVDFLLERPDVDPLRIGTLGMSMGRPWHGGLRRSTRASRSRSISTASPTSRPCSRRRDCHSTVSTTSCRTSSNHFTTAQINALIAPRAHLGLAGLQDNLTPVEGLDIIDRELQQVYAREGHPERWKLLRYDVAHVETPEGRQEIIAFLQRFM